MRIMESIRLIEQQQDISNPTIAQSVPMERLYQTFFCNPQSVPMERMTKEIFSTYKLFLRNKRKNRGFHKKHNVEQIVHDDLFLNLV